MKHHANYASRSGKRSKLSVIQYYAYMMMVRPDSPILPLSGGRLFQQFVVDAYTKAEAQRLRYLRHNQDALRVSEYQEVKKWLADDKAQQEAKKNPKAASLGKPVILPSSYIGAPRALAQNYQDAMAMVRVEGLPDYFITFTANPAWEEIKECLGKNDSTVDRPDLVARVFMLKLKELMHDLTEKGVLGTVRAWTYVVEFQKRGLPHAHILLVMDRKDKPFTVAQIDAVVSARLPDQRDPEQKELFDIVSNMLLHGPCGQVAPNAPCMSVDGHCKKGFPKEFGEVTEIVDDGFPIYGRPDDGRKVEKNGYLFDNRHVVPYTPYLVKKFQAHINTQVVNTIRCVKYLYKYTYKGHDRAGLDFQNDEIKQYLDARYVGPPEACWRIFQFKLHGHSHVVERLPIHLDGEQPVFFQPGQEAEALDQKVTTKLMAFFQCNAANQDKDTWRPLLYSDFPLHYLWDAKTNTWKPRARQVHLNRIIGRMYAVSPAEGDRFYLRILLNHVKGPTCWDDLKVLPDDCDAELPDEDLSKITFQKICQLRGLVDTDDEYYMAMQHCVFMQTSVDKLRDFFVLLLTQCQLNEPAKMWEKFANDLSADFLRMSGHTFKNEEASHNAAKREIQKRLHVLETNLEKFGMTLPEYNAAEVRRQDILHRMTNFDPEESRKLSEANVKKLYDQQREAFDAIQLELLSTGGVE